MTDRMDMKLIGRHGEELSLAEVAADENAGARLHARALATRVAEEAAERWRRWVVSEVARGTDPQDCLGVIIATEGSLIASIAANMFGAKGVQACKAMLSGWVDDHFVEVAAAVVEARGPGAPRS